MTVKNCVILDDDEVDRLMVTAFVKRINWLNIIASCGTATEASSLMERERVDVLFLDIDMPQTSGIEFRKQAMHVPACIYVSAHPEYAVESFELDTLDFLVKPLKFDRFTQAVKRMEDYFELKEKASLFEASIGGDSIFIKDGHQQIKINLYEILYLEALKDYTKIVTPHKTHCVLRSIGNLLKETAFVNFIRVHRSYATQKHLIRSVNTNTVLLNNNLSIPIGRSFKDGLQNLTA